MTETTTRTADFVHLHTHTEYSSALDGLGKVPEAFAAMAADGQPAAAQTDHGRLTGAWSWRTYAEKYGIKPIYGVEAYMSIGSRFEQNARLEDKDESEYGDFDEEQKGKAQQDKKTVRYEHLTILARNKTGWYNLVAMQNEAHNTYWYQPRIDFDLLKEYGDGLIVLTGCLAGPVAGRLKHLTEGANLDPAYNEQIIDEAKANIRRLIDCVGRENVYVEIMEHGIGVEAKVLRALIDIALNWTDENGNPDPLTLVATNDAHYVHEEHCDAHEAWLANKSGSHVGSPGAFRFNGEGYHVRTEAEMRAMGDVIFTREAKRWITEQLAFIRDTDEFKTAYETVATQCEPLVTGGLNSGTRVKQWVAAATSLCPESADLINAWWEEARAEAMRQRIPQLIDIWNQACSNTVLVANRCDDNVLESPGTLLPQFPVPEQFPDSKTYLHHLLVEGAERRYGRDENGNLPQDVRERLAMEFKTVIDMGFPDYFLIVWDLINWANSDRGMPTPEFPTGEPGKKHPILTGPGRGSAAGSIMAYVLNITALCPLKNDLLFERFLEPGRADMPDMDLDFESRRRAEVQEYLTLRWGKKNVAKIGTFQSAKSKSALEDAGRVFGRSEDATALKKLIPMQGGKPTPFADLFDESNPIGADFREELAKRDGDDVRMLIDAARIWENTMNGESIHACGMLVAPIDLTKSIPLRYDRSKSAPKDENGNPKTLVTLWDSKQIEKYGMLKLDVLAIDNLDFMSACFQFIERTTGRKMTPMDIPEPDSGDPSIDAVWELLQEGKTAGVFQLESEGMTSLVEAMQVSTFEDLSAAIALYRPGPLSAGMEKRYVARKHGREPVDYGIFTDDVAEQEAIATILGETFGVFVYQEQLMNLGYVMAGFDAGMRSKLRRAVGKKDKVMMAEVGEAFIEGCVQEQRDEAGNLISMAFSKKTAEVMWENFKGSAEYLFNKSHTAAYGLLSYYTAWLKANYPVEYGAAILSITTKADKRFKALRNLESEGISVLPPDVNRSMAWTAPELDDEGRGTGRIRFGLAEIRDVGVSGLHISNEREKNGPFESLHDLISRVKIIDDKIDEKTGEPAQKKLGITAVEALIEAGACDPFGPRLGLMRIARASAGLVLDVPDGEWPVVFRSMLQRKRLAISVGTHPIVAEDSRIRAWKSSVVDKDGIPINGSRLRDVTDELPRGPVMLRGVISHWEVIQRAKGRFATFSLEGPNGSIDGNVWYDRLSQMYANDEYIPSVGDVVAVSGFVKVTEVQREVEPGMDPDAEAMAETLEARKLNATQILPVVLPHEDRPFGPNTMGGTLVIPPPDGGRSLAAASKAKDAPVAAPAAAMSDSSAVAVLDAPAATESVSEVVSAPVTPDVTPVVAPTEMPRRFEGADTVYFIYAEHPARDRQRAFEDIAEPKRAVNALKRFTHPAFKKNGPQTHIAVNDIDGVVVCAVSDDDFKAMGPGKDIYDVIDAYEAFAEKNPEFSLRQLDTGEAPIELGDNWTRREIDPGALLNLLGF